MSILKNRDTMNLKEQQFKEINTTTSNENKELSAKINKLENEVRLLKKKEEDILKKQEEEKRLDKIKSEQNSPSKDRDVVPKFNLEDSIKSKPHLKLNVNI